MPYPMTKKGCKMKKKPKIKVRKVCEHKEIEQGESYYGHESHQYTTWWYCLDCGKEISNE
tara:strand:- start:450 stop:629 length:180 start_codon:yes stop_codon:yes gene_type:complete